jgi:hypothetical protein
MEWISKQVHLLHILLTKETLTNVIIISTHHLLSDGMSAAHTNRLLAAVANQRLIAETKTKATLKLEIFKQEDVGAHALTILKMLGIILNLSFNVQIAH